MLCILLDLHGKMHRPAAGESAQVNALGFLVPSLQDDFIGLPGILAAVELKRYLQTPFVNLIPYAEADD